MHTKRTQHSYVNKLSILISCPQYDDGEETFLSRESCIQDILNNFMYFIVPYLVYKYWYAERVQLTELPSIEDDAYGAIDDALLKQQVYETDCQ